MNTSTKFILYIIIIFFCLGIIIGFSNPVTMNRYNIYITNKSINYLDCNIFYRYCDELSMKNLCLLRYKNLNQYNFCECFLSDCYKNITK